VSDVADSLHARAFTHEGEIYLPSSAGPTGSLDARRLIAHEMTHVAQQRAYGSRLPSESSTHGQELERLAVAAEQRLDLPLAQPPSIAGNSTEQPPPPAGAQRKPVSPAVHPTIETTTITVPAAVQRAPITADDATTRTTDAPKTTRPKTDAELEELATQLYSRISRRLRRELLVDRERAGVMVDLR
jgi:hypothetical protein